MAKISLTGITPSGTPHIGNYLGMIRPALDLTREYQAYYFMADYHALIKVRDPELLVRHLYEITATWLALGLDPDKVVFYRQSDIPEIPELTWVISCVTPKGLLNRAHAYKAAVDANEAAGNLPDDGVTLGLYSYPVLMAADILVARTNVVPVGQDQRQHIEITRDIAVAFNAVYGETFVVPEAAIRDDVATITGLDGRKMSKSYGNTIEIFAPANQLRKQVMRIVTDSRTPEEPKDPDQDNIYSIFKHFAPAERLQEVRNLYLNGGLAYGAMKQELFELLDATFREPREKYNAYMADTSQLDRILAEGAEKVRAASVLLMSEVRRKVGMRAMPVPSLG